MNTIKEILKPDSKRVLGVVFCLLFVSFIGGTMIFAPYPYWEYGFPLPFVSVYSVRGIWSDIMEIKQVYSLNLFADILFWYFAGALEKYIEIKRKKRIKK